MANIKIVGNQALVESTKTLEEYKLLAKNAPEALALYNKDGEVTFKVTVGPRGSVSRYGATFSGESSVEPHNAIITVEIPASAADKKEWVVENVGPALVGINSIESKMGGWVEKVESDLKTIAESISVLA